MERTLVLIKPDAVERNQIGEVIHHLESHGLKVIALKMVFLEEAEGAGFYQVHKGKPFYENLIRFIASGPLVAMVLEGEEAISRTRTIMGVTDPAQAEEGSIRRKLGTSVVKNAVHGSDSTTSATTEISFFFSQREILSESEVKARKG